MTSPILKLAVVALVCVLLGASGDARATRGEASELSNEPAESSQVIPQEAIDAEASSQGEEVQKERVAQHGMCNGPTYDPAFKMAFWTCPTRTGPKYTDASSCEAACW